ncbi:hypothetical protein WJX73_010238 [Symbiochloris irregularis]|uniref:Uncharacterized protein n=1 Tax=Symbiochloris irregularis TaxID=706552 RepID=A0AAW1NMT1_9CHLO
MAQPRTLQSEHQLSELARSAPLAVTDIRSRQDLGYSRRQWDVPLLPGAHEHGQKSPAEDGLAPPRDLGGWNLVAAALQVHRA